MTDIDKNIIINTLVKAIKSGKLTVEQVDDAFKQEVVERLAQD